MLVPELLGLGQIMFRYCYKGKVQRSFAPALGAGIDNPTPHVFSQAKFGRPLQIIPGPVLRLSLKILDKFEKHSLCSQTSLDPLLNN